MRVLLGMALVAMAFASANAACTEVDNCDTCSNPGALCTSCPAGTIISSDQKKCLDCGTGCKTCSADDKDKVTCLTCNDNYYLNKDACTECDTGCKTCALDTDGKTVKCSACKEAFGTKTDAKTSAISCIACPSKCKTCAVQTDDSTKCSACYDYKGQGKTSYFLKKKDSSCGTCPSNCDSCSDNGEGVGICKSCYKGYVSLTDAKDSTKDGTSCLKCPTDCSTCSGVKMASGDATCTACVADKGLYVSSGECKSCGTGAKSCTDKGAIDSCKEYYRKESTTCQACPAFCKSCSKDTTTNVVSCATCDASYGTKPAKSKTCDACGVANCETCERKTDGKYKCTKCVKGNALKSETECASCSSDCKKDTDCSWDSTNNHIKCTACNADKTSNPAFNSGKCLACSGVTDCTACKYKTNGAATLECTACSGTKLPSIKDKGDKCYANPGKDNKCTKLKNDANDKCAECSVGYSTKSDICEKCPTSCNECTGDPAKCDKKKCASGFILKTYDTTGPCEACDSADLEKVSGTTVTAAFTDCATCEWKTDKSVKCNSCKPGKIFTKDKTKCVANPDSNKKCTEADDTTTANCATCVDGYRVADTASNGCTKCIDANCKTCTTEKTTSKCTVCNAKYVSTDSTNGGTCAACPTNCDECEYDTANTKSKCKSNKCASKFVLTPTGTCESCGDNCASCTYDTANSKVKCSNCEDNYGLKKDDTCAACPSSCKTCARDTAPDADDTLYCSVCDNNYALNSDLCGACPSNCKECSDNGGNMECTKCNDKYALNSKKACVKCPTNCNKCSASGTTTKCSECAIGYSLSGDSTSCTDCATAAFVGCANCTYTDAASGKANCTACASGYTLQDGVGYLSCIDVSSLDCKTGTYQDAPAQCSACSAGFSNTKNKLCAKKCYACGDVNTDVFVDKAKCTIPAAGANATADDATQIDCLSGICYAVYKDGKVAAGCLPFKDATGVCTGDRAAGETCVSTESATQCSRCCSEALCNSFVADMDGKPDSAVSTAINMLLLTVAALMATRFN